ncbi:hypothetical protein GDO78_019826 [Eleutherodactylus coqui]|uniref:Uncharacterized protein n=1 Tax=Eleutherodactylus coqui TaxID=57060 RepID=A0A8J6EIR2_ELECQ|nr:hypothetical protein GDO78_019826 [Eleutherodactylus coqui]
MSEDPSQHRYHRSRSLMFITRGTGAKVEIEEATFTEGKKLLKNFVDLTWVQQLGLERQPPKLGSSPFQPGVQTDAPILPDVHAPNQ